MVYRTVNVRCSTLSLLCGYAADLMNHTDPADRYAVCDLLSLISEQSSAIVTDTEGTEGNYTMIDARCLAEAARQLYDPHGGARNDEAAAVLYQLEGVLTCAECDDFSI